MMDKEKYVVTIATNGKVKMVDAENDLLKQTQRIVGGYIEAIPFYAGGESYQMLMNEEGQLLSLRRNEIASWLLSREIVGDVAIIKFGKVAPDCYDFLPLDMTDVQRVGKVANITAAAVAEWREMQ